jgi:uncharacterized protein (DUF4415 family)
MSKKPDIKTTDSDNPEWTDEMLKQSVRFNDLPASLQAKLRGRPPLAAPKQTTTIRLDADLLDTFRATGKGWQTRINNALRDWLKEHSSA